MVIDKLTDCETAGISESVTIMVKFDVPVAVGVPLIAPVAAFNVNPAGKVPLKMDHVYGAAPPVAATVCE